MQFNSYIFILAFLPAVMLLYYTVGRLHKAAPKLILIGAGLVFYLYTNLRGIWVLLFSLILNLLFAKLITRLKWRKLFTAVPVIVNVGLLLYYKYTDFAIVNINTAFGTDFALKELILPLGISFITFQQIAYIVAVYRGEIERVSVLDYLAYLLYFPKLIMGPLTEPVDFLKQLEDPSGRKVNIDNLACGVKIFSLGLIKKVLLADVFAKACAWGFANPEAATSMDWILITLFYTLEIYFDFSGYSDMAVGSSLMLNITLPMNFNSPYKALSIRDFWKRWHMSLTGFLTKYVYFPLGGSRKGMAFTCLNTMIVFLVSGLWHGAAWTFILWGLLQGVFSVIERLADKWISRIWKPIRYAATFGLVNVFFLLFRSESIGQWIGILRRILHFSGRHFSDGLIEPFMLPEIKALLQSVPFLSGIAGRIRGFVMIAFTVISLLICFVPENNYKRLKKLTVAGMILAAAAFAWGVTCLGEEAIFVYNNF